MSITAMNTTQNKNSIAITSKCPLCDKHDEHGACLPAKGVDAGHSRALPFIVLSPWQFPTTSMTVYYHWEMSEEQMEVPRWSDLSL